MLLKMRVYIGVKPVIYFVSLANAGVWLLLNDLLALLFFFGFTSSVSLTDF